MSKYYLTTTIPYMNAKPHIGHALEFVEADVLVRAKRLLLGKENVYFLSGSDENAIKNVQAAEALGMTTLELMDRNAELFRDLLSALDISTDDFIRTTEERHILGAQALWKATNPEDIYKKSYSGLYCVGCEQFYKPEELKDGKECYDHPGKPLEEVTEENYFFKLSNYSKWLEEAINSNEIRIIPDTRRNEMLSLLKQGLEDFSISRPTVRTKNWGVPVPGDETQTMYVWYDALANYITALGYPEENGLFKDFWKDNDAKGHILGKGVNRFHTIYWPAMLKSAKLPVPNFALVHGYITVDGAKMSKTVGNTVDPQDYIKEFGTDATRFYLLREIASRADGDFSRGRFIESYNAYLANGLGNTTARVLKMAQSNDAHPELPKAEDILKSELFKKVNEFLDSFELEKAIEQVWKKITWIDERIQETQPFKLVKTDPEGAKKIIGELVIGLFEVAVVLQPFLPGTAKKILEAIEAKELPPILFPRKD
jgi:methionyl-tRNA synthetase